MRNASEFVFQLHFSLHVSKGLKLCRKYDATFFSLQVLK